MNIDRTRDKKKKDKNKKNDSSWLEREIFRIMEASLKSAMDQALDEVIKEWNTGNVNVKL